MQNMDTGRLFGFWFELGTSRDGRRETPRPVDEVASRELRAMFARHAARSGTPAAVHHPAFHQVVQAARASTHDEAVLTLPMAKARGFLLHRGSPSNRRLGGSYALSTSVRGPRPRFPQALRYPPRFSFPRGRCLRRRSGRGRGAPRTQGSPTPVQPASARCGRTRTRNTSCWTGRTCRPLRSRAPTMRICTRVGAPAPTWRHRPRPWRVGGSPACP